MHSGIWNCEEPKEEHVCPEYANCCATDSFMIDHIRSKKLTKRAEKRKHRLHMDPVCEYPSANISNAFRIVKLMLCSSFPNSTSSTSCSSSVLHHCLPSACQNIYFQALSLRTPPRTRLLCRCLAFFSNRPVGEAYSKIVHRHGINASCVSSRE